MKQLTAEVVAYLMRRNRRKKADLNNPRKAA
jgi:hypothetical protein